ncbi:MAG: methylcrotonoyl-CoA carboxylase [Bacteroidetes bacterium]|nr:MAG: methylcrotonoyl-CoA carboxylase [Bacteroidota bacterium]
MSNSGKQHNTKTTSGAQQTIEELLKDYYENYKRVIAGGSEAAVALHRSRGKLTARERIDALLDKDSPFLELSALAAAGQYNDQFPSAGIVSGIGKVQGRYVVIVANDATVKGGTYIRETIRKHIRAQEIAIDNHLPAIYLVDSGGIFLPEQSRVFPDKDDFGRIFSNQARISAMGIPQVAVVMGSCTAGGAYIPAMSDESIIVKNQGTIFIGGPPLVKAATGEEVTDEELGGGDVHARISGVVDHLADDDLHALKICRNIVSGFHPSQPQMINRIEGREPLLPSRGLHKLAVNESGTLIDHAAVIEHIVDGGEFQPFKQEYAKTLITGFARINGYQVGIVANNGVVFGETSRKGAHFVQLCNFRKTPIIFLHDVTGFIVGKKYEHDGIARDGAKWIHAVSTSAVPLISVVTGGSYGAGNYAMAGRAFDPRFLFMWPNARIGVMGGDQAARVLTQLKKAKGKNGADLEAKSEEQLYKEIKARYDYESSAMYSTSRIWDDGIIDPANTRTVLSMVLDIVTQRQWPEFKPGVYRM